MLGGNGLRSHVWGVPLQLIDMRTVGDKVHSHNSNCIYSVANVTETIEFSLSIAEQRAVGFIPAWSLASLHLYSTSSAV